MDPKDIPEELKRVGKKQADLARFMPLDPSSLTKLIKGERSMKVPELRRLEEFFSAANGGEPVERLASRRAEAQARIPLFGVPHGDDGAVLFTSGREADWISPPIVAPANVELVAVRVPGDQMEPRMFQGEIVVAQVRMPPARDRDCVVEFTDGTAIVRTFKGLRDGRVHLELYHPASNIHVDATKVRALHAVLARL